MLMPVSQMRKRVVMGVVIVMLIGVGMYGFVPQLDSFDSSWRSLQGARPGYVVAAAAATLAASLLAAILYMLISFHRLALHTTLLVQLSGLFVNRILPAGVGGVGLNYLYLRAKRHSVIRAGAVVSLNNLMGFVGHMVLVLLVLLWYALTATDVPLKIGSGTERIAVLGGVAVVLAVMFVAMRSTLQRWLRRSGKQLRTVWRYYARRPETLGLALFVSMSMTLASAASLWLCSEALGLGLNIGIVFAIFTLGVAAATVTPTPGGIGGAEAALTAGFIAQGIPASQALACALLFRLVSYWFGIVVGSFAFAWAYGHGLFRKSS